MRSADDYDAIRERMGQLGQRCRVRFVSGDYCDVTLPCWDHTCHGRIFDPKKQRMIPASFTQHKFCLATKRCEQCGTPWDEIPRK